MASILNAEDVVRRIAAECAYVDERVGVGIRLEPAAAILRRYGDNFRRPPRRKPRRIAKGPPLALRARYDHREPSGMCQDHTALLKEKASSSKSMAPSPFSYAARPSCPISNRFERRVQVVDLESKNGPLLSPLWRSQGSQSPQKRWSRHIVPRPVSTPPWKWPAGSLGGS
jgi:hypothetical protein